MLLLLLLLFLLFIIYLYYTARWLTAAQCIVIGPVCVFVCLQRAGGVRTVLQPARAQCLRLSERFFDFIIFIFFFFDTEHWSDTNK